MQLSSTKGEAQCFDSGLFFSHDKNPRFLVGVGLLKINTGEAQTGTQVLVKETGIKESIFTGQTCPVIRVRTAFVGCLLG
jgi:hypothetical protein